MFLVTPGHGQPWSWAALNREQPEAQQRSCAAPGSGREPSGIKKAGVRLTGRGRKVSREANLGKRYRGGSFTDAASPALSPPAQVALAPRSFISGIGAPVVPPKPVPSPKFISPKRNSIFLGLVSSPLARPCFQPSTRFAGTVRTATSPGLIGTSSGRTGAPKSTS